MTESRISGALEPRAMSVRLDTVSFHMRTVATDVSPLGKVMVTSFSCRPTHTDAVIYTIMQDKLMELENVIAIIERHPAWLPLRRK